MRTLLSGIARVIFETRRDDLKRSYESLAQREWFLPIVKELISGKHKRENAYKLALSLVPKEASATI